MKPEACGPFGKDIRDPQPWPDDGGEKRVEVRDPNWLMPNGEPRLVRLVGWRACFTNRRHRFWSPDIARVRCCPVCKTYRTDEHYD